MYTLYIIMYNFAFFRQTHTHIILMVIFQINLGLAGFSIDSQSPVILFLSILKGQAKLFVLHGLLHQLTLTVIPRGFRSWRSYRPDALFSTDQEHHRTKVTK